MIPLGSKALTAFGAAALVASIAYGLKVNEPTTTLILGFAAFGAWALAVAVALAAADHAPWIVPGSPIAEQPPTGARPERPSIWPLGAALGVGLFTVGAAANGVVQLAAVAVLVLVGGGWLIQQWAEHHSYVGLFGARLRERFLLPLGLPVAVVALVATILISLSRVFLALPEQGTRAVALAIAVIILISAFAVAASQRMARTALMLLSAFALACALAAGVVGVVHGERTFEKPKLTDSFVPAPGQAPPQTTTTAASTQSATSVP